MEKTLNTANKKSDGKAKAWTPNEKQKQFLEVLKEYPDGTTMKDIEIDKGLVFASGTTNTLISKGLVVATDSDRISDIVYRNTVIGHKTDHVKTYKLA